MSAFSSSKASIRAAAVVVLLATTGATSAGAEKPDQGVRVVTALGASSSAETYWVDEAEGFRVFTTVRTLLPGDAGREDRHAIVRFSTILRYGQTQTISVPEPRAGSGGPSAIQLRRLADRVEVKAVTEVAGL